MSSAFRILQSFWRATRDRGFRDDLLWRRLKRPPGVFQISGDTREDRYPDIFRFVRDELGGAKPVRLLSFGCSTGEEVFTLRRYFPGATIDGVDINPYRVAAARERLRRRGGDPALSFAVAGSAKHLPDGYYDAIFCLAVFRHGGLQPGPAPRCDHLIKFAAVEQTVTELARCLKSGGFLAIAHSNFRFADMAVAASFETAVREAAESPHEVTPLYGPDNRLLPGARSRDVVFRKRLTSDGAECRP